MRKWKYEIKNSTNLRKSIHGENYGDIIRELRKCYNEIINDYYKIVKNINNSRVSHLGDIEYLYSDACDQLDYIEGEDILCDDKDCESLEDFGFDSFEELVDERLEEFYNMCDSYDLFVAI